jgi:hypothetical protein
MAVCRHMRSTCEDVEASTHLVLIMMQVVGSLISKDSMHCRAGHMQCILSIDVHHHHQITK